VLTAQTCYLGGRVHAPDVLHQQVLATEVVGFGTGRGAQIATPEVEAHMLGIDMAFPLVLGAECGVTAVWQHDARERPVVFELVGHGKVDASAQAARVGTVGGWQRGRRGGRARVFERMSG